MVKFILSVLQNEGLAKLIPISSKCNYYHLASFSRVDYIVSGHNRLFDTKFDKITSFITA